MRSSKSTMGRPLSRKLRDLLQVVAMLLVAIVAVAAFGGLWYLNDAYTENGFRNCRSNGSSYTWCQATIRWQAFKALF